MKTEPTNNIGRAAFIQQGEQILSLVESANALHTTFVEVCTSIIVIPFVHFNFLKPKSPMATEPKPNLNFEYRKYLRTDNSRIFNTDHVRYAFEWLENGTNDPMVGYCHGDLGHRLF